MNENYARESANEQKREVKQNHAVLIPYIGFSSTTYYFDKANHRKCKSHTAHVQG